MQCPKCRAAMPNGAKYCTECGTKLPVQPDSVPVQSQRGYGIQETGCQPA